MRWLRRFEQYATHRLLGHGWIPTRITWWEYRPGEVWAPRAVDGPVACIRCPRVLAEQVSIGVDGPVVYIDGADWQFCDAIGLRPVGRHINVVVSMAEPRGQPRQVLGARGSADQSGESAEE